LLPSFNVGDIEGYYQDATVDISDLVQVGSKKMQRNKNTQPRYVEIAFKNASDNYISSRKLSEQPFSKKIDLGVSFTNAETQKLENPLFEPSLELELTQSEAGETIPFTNIPTGELPFILAYWDNENRSAKTAFSGYRLAYRYGLTEQRHRTLGTARRMFFEDTELEEIPYVSQNPSEALYQSDIRIPQYFIGYANDINDFYTKYYAKTIMAKISEFDIEFLIWLSSLDFKGFDFRKKYAVMYGEAMLLYRAKAIRDFHTRTRQTTPISFKLIGDE